MAKAVLFQEEESTETVVTIQDSRGKGQPNSKFTRANTNVGVMNKFILQFSRVEKAYRLIEEAFSLIAQSASTRSLTERMKRKCKMSHVSGILEYLGFDKGEFTNKELKDIFDKDPETETPITFQRLLIGVGLCYFAKLEKQKKAKEEEEENSGTEIEHPDAGADAGKADVLLPDTSVDDDSKDSEEEIRLKCLAAGFTVVRAMFDVIDEDGSGEISLEEFEHSFSNICRDPELVKQRMSELDYNNDQNISFREFIFGISSWCGFNDEMINDEGDDDLDAAPLSPQTTAE